MPRTELTVRGVVLLSVHGRLRERSAPSGGVVIATDCTLAATRDVSLEEQVPRSTRCVAERLNDHGDGHTGLDSKVDMNLFVPLGVLERIKHPVNGRSVDDDELKWFGGHTSHLSTMPIGSRHYERRSIFIDHLASTRNAPLQKGINVIIPNFD